MAKLESLFRLIQTGDTFIFVFASHGINREQKSFLLAIDSDSRLMRTLEKSTVPLEMVSEILSEIRASPTLTVKMILEAILKRPQCNEDASKVKESLLGLNFSFPTNNPSSQVWPPSKVGSTFHRRL